MKFSECRKNTQNIIAEERRSLADRRKQRSFSIRLLLYGGRRETIRRYEDRHKLFYVDRYSQSHFGVIAIILFLSVADALLTIVLTEHGAEELNPIMAYCLDFGLYTFISVKYFLTAIGLITLLMLRNILIKPIQIFAGSLFYFFLVAFIGVVSWQIFLIYRVMA
jgi:hypothetical protein